MKVQVKVNVKVEVKAKVKVKLKARITLIRRLVRSNRFLEMRFSKHYLSPFTQNSYPGRHNGGARTPTSREHMRHQSGHNRIHVQENLEGAITLLL